MMLYITLQQKYQIMVERHEARAQYWLAQGRPDYAAGSLRKADKWRVKAREYDRMMNGLYPQTKFEDLLQRKIEEAAEKMAGKLELKIWG
jgi:frataxin-like iron-binding protein CyaY